MKIIKYVLVTVLIFIYALINLFVMNTINNDLIRSLNLDIKFILEIIFIIGTLATILTYGFASKSVGGFMGKTGMYAFGFSIISFFLILITNLLAELIFWGNINYKYFGIVQIVILLGVFIYGRLNASNVKIRNYNIDINKKSELDKLNVVLISDLHLGYFNDNEKLLKNVERINKLSPDVVLIAGDLFDQNFASLQNNMITKEFLNEIKSKYGVYVTFGNHDSGPTYEQMKEFVLNSNMKLLEDEIINFENKFAIAGRRDLSPIGFSGDLRNDNWNLQMDKDLVLIVVDHQPIFKNYDENVDLIVSGHTHKGQIFPFGLITKKYFENDYGYAKLKSGIQSIVTSGLGTWGPPMRIGTNNEIVKINISFKNN
ncbi:MAG: metallophosphoesterase [Sarcina sp.]